MTCELISAAVTNAETMPAEAEQKFSLHKRVIVNSTSEWDDWRNSCLWYRGGNWVQRLQWHIVPAEQAEKSFLQISFFLLVLFKDFLNPFGVN